MPTSLNLSGVPSMGQTKKVDTGSRGSFEGWLDAAYDELIETGVDAVRILQLSDRLKLSRTSFYWFFKDRDALLAVLLERWRAKNTGNLVRQAQAYAETITEAILNVFDCWLDSSLFDSKFEFAVRSWAQQAPHVAEEIAKADDTRIAALADMFSRFGFPKLSADVRARTIYLTQIGYISMKTTEALATRMTRIPSYVEIFTSKPPSKREWDRFRARHGSNSPNATGSRVKR
jgi:AcrR family transcriptional regulator